MTMHLLPAMFSTTGKSKNKKFKNSNQARTSAKNKASWEELLEKYDVKPNSKPKTKSAYKLEAKRGGSKRDVYKSLETGFSDTSKPKEKVYTGDAMLGVSTLHKSNAVPVFRQSDAIDVAKMRRG